MPEISNELRARVFALHLGCGYTYENEFGRYKNVVDWKLLQKIQTGYGIDPQLLLTPLSEISDADAIEVAKIVMPVASGDYLFVVMRMDDKVIVRFNENVDVAIFYDGNIVIASVHDEEYMPAFNIPNAVDLLRSKEYALPAYGIPDLFEAGIAVRKES